MASELGVEGLLLLVHRRMSVMISEQLQARNISFDSTVQISAEF